MTLVRSATISPKIAPDDEKKDRVFVGENAALNQRGILGKNS